MTSISHNYQFKTAAPILHGVGTNHILFRWSAVVAGAIIARLDDPAKSGRFSFVSAGQGSSFHEKSGQNGFLFSE